MITQRPIVFDVTHLVSRLPNLTSTGIDRIDLAYAMHFARPGGMVAGIHYGLSRPHLFSVEQAREFVALSGSLWTSDSGDALGSAFSDILEWLAAAPDPDLQKPRRQIRQPGASRGWRRLSRARGRILNNASLSVPRGAIYLNVAQHLFERPIFFRWLEKRKDLRNVFMIHDLLSLDYPEYFSPDNLRIFQRRLATAFFHADAFLVSSHAVERRLELELRREGPHRIPIHVQPFPSPLEGMGGGDPATGVLQRGHPYFVILATVEPRKNHLLLLHAWRDLVVRDPRAPRLVMIGARGWENEQVADILDRSIALQGHILEIRGLPSSNLIDLLRSARALLLPSFDEGYGLPLVEALSIGTPVVASDIPVFREVTQGHATFLSPRNGEAWAEVVKRFANDEVFVAAKRAEALRFEAPTWTGYFAGLNRFLNQL